MSDEIKLSLDPTPAAPQITLTLDGTPAPAPTVQPVDKKNPLVEQAEQRTAFSPEEQKQIDEFAQKIDITDTNLVFQYGAACQQNIASFSDSALQNVRTKDLGEVGDIIGGLVTELKGFTIEEEEPRGILGFFKKSANQIEQLKARYDKAEVNVNKICNTLEDHQVQLLKDISMLDQMYELNLRYFKELSMYIAAGKQRLKQVRETDVAQAFAKAQASGLPEDAQAAKDLSEKCDRFEKKLYDLELTRNISIQMAPQIRLLQNNDSLMAEKIQSSLVNTIPLWKSQMVLALGLANAESAMRAQRAVTDVTNELLRKNAERLRTGTLETARESERGIVDIETLKATNETLISTLDEVMTIQQQGREKRRQAEVELANIENQLKNKLLEIRG